MSLYVYSGVPGSGKTYHAVRDIKNNRAPVITNVNIAALDNVAVLDIHQITPELLMAYSEHYFKTHPYKENHLLVVIDEAQLLFNSRSWNDENRFDWLKFLSQHRKYGYKCIFVAQDISMIDKQFRCLCEFDVRHTAASSISFITRAVSLLGLRLTCAKYYYFDSEVLVMRDFYRISKKIYKHYQTSQDIVAPDFSSVDLSPILSQLEPSAICDLNAVESSQPSIQESVTLERMQVSDTEPLATAAAQTQPVRARRAAAWRGAHAPRPYRFLNRLFPPWGSTETG